MLNSIHCRPKNNIGDKVCSPMLYFNFNKNVTYHDFYNINDTLSGNVILGGGGLFNDHFYNALKLLLQLKRLKQIDKLICWGTGLNIHYGANLDIMNFFNEFLSECTVVGMRDYKITSIPQYTWVPCVSCMSNLFDIKYKIEHDVVIYEHHMNPIQIDNIPKIKNSTGNLDDVIKFMGSANVVITNSYHGVYWATLLKKKVLTLPFSSRFDNFKHPIIICNENNWKNKIREAVIYDRALTECRSANIMFYNQILPIV